MQKTKSGFTIVELLIVIVVIAILAAISVVAYSGLSQRANDSRRLLDANEIVKSLERYRALNGSYPDETAFGSWESSNGGTPGGFMEYLADYGFPNGTPIDPVNNSSFRYSYYYYPAGDACPVGRGAYYVLLIRLETISGQHPSSPGFSCTGRAWDEWSSWYIGKYEN